MDKGELRKLTNEELDDLLNQADWCDKELLREYDERKRDGRIIFKPIGDLEKHFRERREKRMKKAS